MIFPPPRGRDISVIACVNSEVVDVFGGVPPLGLEAVAVAELKRNSADEERRLAAMPIMGNVS